LNLSPATRDAIGKRSIVAAAQADLSAPRIDRELSIPSYVIDLADDKA